MKQGLLAYKAYKDFWFKRLPLILKVCTFCSKAHEALKTKYPAWGKSNYCEGRNHFKCKKINEFNPESNFNDYYADWLANATTTDNILVTGLIQ